MSTFVATFPTKPTKPTDIVFAAPIAAINRLLEKHEPLRQLVHKGWPRLFAVYDDGKAVARYSDRMQWESAITGVANPAAAEAEN